jgi:hypothetical protein
MSRTTEEKHKVRKKERKEENYPIFIWKYNLLSRSSTFAYNISLAELVSFAHYLEEECI